MTDAEMLRVLADWFDRSPRVANMKGDEVQRDLRRIANRLDLIDAPAPAPVVVARHGRTIRDTTDTRPI